MSQIPVKKAIATILLSVLLVSGTATLGWGYFQYIRHLRETDNQYKIIAVVQTGPEKEALKSVYLEELLDISVDRPSNLYKFNTRAAEAKLLRSPLIKKAVVKKVRPGTLYIDYSVRQPVAYVGDFSNTAIDEEGTLIPFKPFFTPKKIPEFYLGISEMPQVWGATLRDQRGELALNLLKLLSEQEHFKHSNVKRIDVSRAYADSYGQRQVILMIEDWYERVVEGHSILCISPRILRLSTENYKDELQQFRLLQEFLQRQESQQIIDAKQAIVKAEPMVIDMRIPQLAYFQE